MLRFYSFFQLPRHCFENFIVAQSSDFTALSQACQRNKSICLRIKLHCPSICKDQLPRWDMLGHFVTNILNGPNCTFFLIAGGCWGSTKSKLRLQKVGDLCFEMLQCAMSRVGFPSGCNKTQRCELRFVTGALRNSDGEKWEVFTGLVASVAIWGHQRGQAWSSKGH